MEVIVGESVALPTVSFADVNAAVLVIVTPEVGGEAVLILEVVVGE